MSGFVFALACTLLSIGFVLALVFKADERRPGGLVGLALVGAGVAAMVAAALST